MKFRVENFGVLKEAEVELGDLTVFCGKNNSGKTYMAYLIYGILDHYNPYRTTINKNFEKQIYSSIKKRIHNKRKFLIDTSDYIDSLIDDTIPVDLLNTVFNSNDFNNSRVKWEWQDDFYKSEYFSSLTVYNKEDPPKVQVNKKKNSNCVEFLINDPAVANDFISQIDPNYQLEYDPFKLEDYLRTMLFSFVPEISLLPSMREGLTTVYSEISTNRENQLYDETSNRKDTQLKATNISHYPIPVSDYISLLKMDISLFDKRSNKELINELFSIIGGKYSSNGLMKTFKVERDNQKLKI